MGTAQRRPAKEIALKIALLRADMTQRELAARLCVTDSVVSDYIAGRKTIPLDRRLEIAQILEADMASLGW